MTAPRPGRVPLASVLLVETGFAVALVLAAVDRGLVPVGGTLLAATLPVALLRLRGRWLVEWVAVAVRYRCRVRERVAEPAQPSGSAVPAGADEAPLGEDRRLLRLVAGDVVTATCHDHDGRAVGLLGQDGAWTAVLAPDTDAAPLVTGPSDRPTLPWPALAEALRDRGVVLDALTALWHRPARSPGATPAAEAHGELVDPLAGAGTRRMCLVLRLDPSRCPDAVAARGGGAAGAQRALLGAVARVRRVLSEHGVATRPLDADEIVDTAVTSGLAGLGAAPTASERWDAVLVAGDDGESGHATFELRPVPTTPGSPTAPEPLDAVWSAPGAATTLAVALAPGPDAGDAGDDGGARVALRCLVRLTAPTPATLSGAGVELARSAARARLPLRRLDGEHAAGLVATLPVPSPPVPRTRSGGPLVASPAAFGSVSPTDLEGLGPPPDGPAVVLGADAGGAVMLALVRDRPTRMVVLGGLSLACEVVLRAVGSGTALALDSRRPGAWDAVVRAAADDGAAGSAPRGERPTGDRAGGVLAVHDHGLSPHGPDTPPGPGRTTLVVLPSLTPAVADLADDADLVLLTRMPPHEAELAGRLWRLNAGMVEELRTLPDHGVVALGPQLWRRADRVSVPRETAILGPVRLGD